MARLTLSPAMFTVLLGKPLRVTVLVAVAIPLVGFGEKPKSALTPSKVDHILLEVADLRISIAFYRDLLGLQLKTKTGHFATLESENVGVFLWSKRWDWEAPRAKGERQGLGIYPHLKVNDVSAVVKQAEKAGYKIVQKPKHYLWGTEAFIADPDGYVWAIIS